MMLDRAMRARLAAREFNRMVPSLTAFTRSVSGKPGTLVSAGERTQTDGKTVFIRPPLALADKVSHDRRLCDTRGDDYSLQCPACARLEELFTLIYHEVAHVAADSVGAHETEHLRKWASEGVKLSGHPTLDGFMPKGHGGRRNMLEFAALMHPFADAFVRVTEEVRVDTLSATARPGVGAMRFHQSERIFDGRMEGMSLWKDQPLERQIPIALLAARMGHSLESRFSAEAIEVAEHPPVADILYRPCTTVREVVVMAFGLLGALNTLGLYLAPEQQEQDDDGDSSGDAGKAEPGDGPGDGAEGGGDKGTPDGDAESEPDGGSGGGGDGSDGGPKGGAEGEADADGETAPDGNAESPRGDELNDDAAKEDATGEAAAGEGVGGGPGEDGRGEAGVHAGGEGDAGEPDTGGASESVGDEDLDGGGAEDARAPQDRGENDEAGSCEGADYDRATVQVAPEAPDFTDLPDSERATAGELREAMEQATGHEEHVAMSGHGGVDEATMRRAIAQAMAFDAPSSRVSGVTVFEGGKGPAWDGDRRMSKHEPVADRLLAPSVQHARRVFSDSRIDRNVRNLRKGKISAAALGKRAWGDDDRLFKKKLRAEGIDFEVVIGMDVSASTANGCIYLIKEAADALANVLHRVGVDFSVYAHTTGKHEDERGMIHQDMHLIKATREPWAAPQRKLLADVQPVGGSLDGHNLEFYRKVLDRSRAKKRMIVYFTDGQIPETNRNEERPILLREVKLIKKSGYGVMAVGIGNDSPKQYGLDTIRIDHSHDIVTVIKELEKRITT